MEKILKSFINEKRIELISKICNEESSKQIEKEFTSALENSFKKIDSMTISFIELISKIDNIPSLSDENKDSYSIGNRKIHIINTEEKMNFVVREIEKSNLIGFDTEQKPVFKKGEKPTKIAIIQMADKYNCYIFQVQQIRNIRPILGILNNKNIVKVGIGLKGDAQSLFDEYKIRVKSCLDFGSLFRTKLYYQNDIGAKKATLLFLNQKLQKSSKATKSNWEANSLSQSQIKYAAEDATCVYDCFKQMLINYPYLIKILPIWFENMHKNDCFKSL